MSDNPYDLDTRDAAEYLGLRPNTLEIYRTKGKGPAYVKLAGHLVRYCKADLDAWVTAQRYTSTAQYPTHLHPERAAA